MRVARPRVLGDGRGCSGSHRALHFARPLLRSERATRRPLRDLRERVDDRNGIKMDKHVGVNCVHAVRPVCNGVRRS